MFMGDDAEKKALETQNKICSAMTQTELETGKVSSKDKEAIAHAAQVQRDEVEDLLGKFRTMQGFH